ncbi:ABC-2 type transport system permease protein [Amphibacillus marinus]|uniref:ABC-2 type transport system permease protein n=1 Tax=Amphibacillus marinus TaxID=872970 RepID=A0A1H8RSZ4_9BACI|nr:ABC transporter permease [Amphibacillus marinus]SEO69490.1 ABC-2 type transport system permease protein [Amphibacillus marinus]
MNKFWVVFCYTFLSRVKSKSFIITTALFLVSIVALGNIDRLIGLFDNDAGANQVAVIDQTDTVFSLLEEFSDQDELIFVEFNDSLSAAEQAVLAGTYTAVLVIEEDNETIFQASYHTDQLINQSVPNQTAASLQQIKVALATNEAGIDQATIDAIYQPFDFDTVAIELADGRTARTEEEIGVARGLVYAMLFILYFAVLMYGNMIAMDIANEKSSRVMEILISSSSPIKQMFAKIFGIALLGLIQISLFITVSFYVVESRADNMIGEAFEFFGVSNVPLSTYIYAVVFFLLGYLLYATLSAMLGSLVSRLEDVGQLMMPVTFLIIIAFMISMFGIGVPDSTLITITSHIPFFTPLVMFLRVGLLEIPTWEIALSLTTLILSILILGYVGAKVYRGGVLMYGKSASLKDFKQAIQLGKRDN